MECPVPFTDCELSIFRIQEFGLRPFVITTLLTPVAIFNVILGPFICIINMMNFDNKHVKYILYAICPNHLINKYNIYSLQTFKYFFNKKTNMRDILVFLGIVVKS
jgi:hypothetical protein